MKKKFFLLSVIVILLLLTIIALIDLSRSAGQVAALAYQVARAEEALAEKELRNFIGEETSWSSWTKEDHVIRQELADEREVKYGIRSRAGARSAIFRIIFPLVGIITIIYIMRIYILICVIMLRKQKKRRKIRPAL